MGGSLRHSLRLIHVARTLARHDALFTLEFMKQAPPALLFARRIANLSLPFGRKNLTDMRPGQKLALAFEKLGPGFIKLGQSMATRPDLIGEEMAEDLASLQDRLPPFPGVEARRILEAELGKPVSEIFQSFDDEAVAAASIAQVHFAVTLDGREVAVKILRPNIEAAFARDLDMFAWAARLIERAEPKSRRLRPSDVIATLARSVALEMDLRHEAAACTELAENMQANPDYEVPAVDWERTSTRVLTLARINGIAFNDNEGLDRAGVNREILAERLVTAFLTQALFHGFFHADLHQGNLFRGEGDRIIAVDFGIMGRLDRKTRHTLAEILYGFITRDYDALAEAHFAAGYVPESQSREEFAQAMRAIGEPIAGKPIKDVSLGKLLAQLLETTARFSMQTQPQLLLLQKTMVMAEGVALNVYPDVNMWEIAQPVIESWMQENLGPKAEIRKLGKGIFQSLRRLPALIEGFDAALKEVSENGLRLHPDTVQALVEASRQKTGAAKSSSPYLWALAGGISGIFITLVFLLY